MAFSTHCSKNRRTEWGRPRWWCVLALSLALLAAWSSHACATQSAHAEPDVGELRLERTDDGLYLSAQLQFGLPELAEDALHKGIPIFFVAEAQVLRNRWYWSDRPVAETTRYLRLSYQPLTRRWRLNISSVPFTNSGIGVVLAQNFDDIGEALAAIQRIARWKIADAGAISADAAHTVNFRFRLDLSQLPRPLQIGAVGRSGWTLLVSRSQPMAAEAGK
jgi:hypothetical protein